MKIDPYQLFSICTCIYFGLAKIFMKTYTCIQDRSRCCCLYVQFDYLSMKTVMSLYIRLLQNVDFGDIYIHVGKNIGTGIIVFLLPSVNTLLFREISTFSFTLTGSHAAVKAIKLFSSQNLPYIEEISSTSIFYHPF